MIKSSRHSRTIYPFIVALVLILLPLTENVASAATYYVATTGSDSNPGTEALPLRTIAFAYGKTNPGDTVIVKPGTYTEYKPGYGILLDRSGTAAAPITLKSQIKWQAVLDGQNLTDHVHILLVEGQYHIIEGFDIKNGYKDGIQIWRSNNQIKENHIHHNGNQGDPNSNFGHDGVFSSAETYGNSYVGNYIHHNGRISINSNLDHGLYLCGDDELVVNNIVTHNSAFGLHLAGYDTQRNLKAYNNVFAFNGRSGAILWMSFSGVYIKNNIFYKNAIYGIDSWDAHGTGVVFDNNLFYGNPSGTIRTNNGGSDFSYTMGLSLNGNPLFANEASDFSVKPGSPAIDTGLTLTEVATDIDGLTRPLGSAFDIGAYEFRDGDTTPPAPPKGLKAK
jgi:hypothetical protein